MLTEQNPPCAAKLGVPNCLAHQPVKDWLWSRPVNKRQLARLGRADVAEPLGGDRQRLVPLDLAEVARAALAGRSRGLVRRAGE